MLESRLILKVTVLAPEPHDHVANGHTVKDRVVGPDALTLLPGGAQRWAAAAYTPVTSSVTKAFRDLLHRLPTATQEQAARAYALWRTDPYHNSLQFKRVSQRQPIYAVRVGLGYRALGLREGDHVYWFWIGPHAEYDALLKRI